MEGRAAVASAEPGSTATTERGPPNRLKSRRSVALRLTSNTLATNHPKTCAQNAHKLRHTGLIVHTTEASRLPGPPLSLGALLAHRPAKSAACTRRCHPAHHKRFSNLPILSDRQSRHNAQELHKPYRYINGVRKSHRLAFLRAAWSDNRPVSLTWPLVGRPGNKPHCVWGGDCRFEAEITAAPAQRQVEDPLMSDETICVPRPAGWQLSDTAVPQCESVAGQLGSAVNARILACMPDMHTPATIPISSLQSGSSEGRWLSAGMSAKLLLGASALLVAVALVPALFRSKQPDEQQTAWRSTGPAPDAEMPPLWSGIADGGPKVDLSATTDAAKSRQPTEGNSKPTGHVAAASAETGPTEKTPDVSIWPDPNRSIGPARSQQFGATASGQSQPVPPVASLPDQYRQGTAWPAASGEGASVGSAAGAGQFTVQSNRPASLNPDRGGIDRTAASGPQAPADRPAATGDVPWYEPWSPPEAQQPSAPQYQARYERPQPESPPYRQSEYHQPQYQSSEYQRPQYQQSQYQQPDYRASPYQHSAQRPEDYPQYRRWESQPTSYQAPPSQTAPLGQDWQLPRQSPPAQGLPQQQSPPPYWQQQPEQQYQWDYTPDYRRQLPASRASPGGQLPDGQQPYVPQPYAPQQYAPQSYAPHQHQNGLGRYPAQQPHSSVALVDRTMPTPPDEPGSAAPRYASATLPADVGQQGQYDVRVTTAAGDARLGTNASSIPARANYERAGSGTY